MKVNMQPDDKTMQDLIGDIQWTREKVLGLDSLDSKSGRAFKISAVNAIMAIYDEGKGLGVFEYFKNPTLKFDEKNRRFEVKFTMNKFPLEVLLEVEFQKRYDRWKMREVV
jgi:hypothetical protein